MESIKISIPHIQQPKNSAWCGAACLAMLYAHFGISLAMADIWPQIKKIDPSTGRENCQTYLMGLHAQAAGLRANVITCDKPLELTQACLSADIGIIALRRNDPLDPHGHFCVLTGTNYKGVYINDPQLDASKGSNNLLSIEQFLTSLRPYGEVTTKNTFLLIAPLGTPILSVSLSHEQSCVDCQDIMRTIKPFASSILCLKHNLWAETVIPSVASR